MTSTAVGIYEAKTTLSKLVERVEAGEEIDITRRGEVVARLVPVKRGVKQFGRNAGRVVIHDNFDDPLPEFADYS